MRHALVNMKLHSVTEGWLDDMAVVLRGEKIEALMPTRELPADIQCINLQGAYLVPGFFDTQVNGGGGVLLNDKPTVEGLESIAQAHRLFGTTALLPTLISDDLTKVQQAIAAVEQSISRDVLGIEGIHIEGPFLNAERKGVHDQTKFCSLDKQAVQMISALQTGKTLLTLAPELNDVKYIDALSKAGVVVAAGHSAATYDDIQAAISAGLKSFTHLYNAMSPLTSRAPGVVGAALEDRETWVGLIVDGYHVHDAALRVAIAAKPRGKAVLVTDAMPSVGASDKQFLLNGELIQARDGRCATASGTLAGSDLDMLSAVKNTVTRLGLSLNEAVNMASRYPATMMGLDHKLGSLAPGLDASMLVLNKDLVLEASWVKGHYLVH